MTEKRNIELLFKDLNQCETNREIKKYLSDIFFFPNEVY